MFVDTPNVFVFVLTLYVLCGILHVCKFTSVNSWQTPACLDDGLNPTSKIRGALAMLFFATFFQLLCFLVRTLVLLITFH